MAEQKVDIEALRSLNETLTSLITYTGALREGAGGFAYMLPAEWQGPAMTQFLSTFEMWAVNAETLRLQTEQLQKLAEAALTAYESTIDDVDDSWSKIRSGLGA